MYQVIVNLNGELFHDGFFEDIRQAEEHKNRVSDRLFIGTEEDFHVFVNEIEI